jgi:hypothetical protein
MAHKHSIYDSDSHFSINPTTRAIKNESSTKTTLIQHDHNSERFTFEIPRNIEGHDMSLCNVVQVHYLNIESGNKNQNADVYDVVDMQLSPEDENIVICSWLISSNATKYVGSLNFIVRFACVTDNVVDYVWNTAVHSGISVSTGINNTEMVVEEYSDIIASWTARIEALEQGGGSGGGGSAERPTAEIVVDLNEGSLLINELGNQSLSIIANNELIPEGVEVKDVQFLYNDEYISIYELHKADNGIPYYYNVYKTYKSVNAGGVFICAIGYGSNMYGDVIQSYIDYESSLVKIIYYTD